MTDRRVFRSNGSVAHESLRGMVDGVDFTEGKSRAVSAPVANLLTEPTGKLDRQLVYGDEFCALQDDGEFAFGFAVPSGFVGYIASQDLCDAIAPTHRVISMGAHIYTRPSIKTIPAMAVPFDALISATEQADGFWQCADGFIPEQQVARVDQVEPDTAATALRFLGVPYLWGGDSNYGIDCSGLVHVALKAAGRDCPRDSDQQETFYAEIERLQRGDLVFWKGHVGMMVDTDRIVHANGHHMATTLEPLDVVSARILEAEGKEISSFRRP